MQIAVLPSCASAHIRSVWGSAMGKSRLPQPRSRAASQVSELITSWTSRTYSSLFITDTFGPAAHWIIATTQLYTVSMHRRGEPDFSWLWACLCVLWCGVESTECCAEHRGPARTAGIEPATLSSSWNPDSTQVASCNLHQ